jgi:hypothetical protein
VKKLVSIILLVLFCLTQCGVIGFVRTNNLSSTLAKFVKLNANTSEEEETGEGEPGQECFVHITNLTDFSDLFLIQSSGFKNFLNLLHASSHTKKDLRPPC